MTVKVYEAIAAVQGELSKHGISKDRKNQQQNYNFRGIDDVYAALSPLLAKHKLCVIPRVTERIVSERPTKSGSINFNVAVHAEFDFVSAEDGSKHTCATFGEAQDMADKATNKAMSAAYKYAAFMTFAIPVEGEEDADAVTPEPTVRQQKAAPKAAPRGDAGGAIDTETVMNDLLRHMWRASSLQDLSAWYKNNAVMIDELTEPQRDKLRGEYKDLENSLKLVAQVAA